MDLDSQYLIKLPSGLNTNTGIFPRLKQYKLSCESIATDVASWMNENEFMHKPWFISWWCF